MVANKWCFKPASSTCTLTAHKMLFSNILLVCWYLDVFLFHFRWRIWNQTALGINTPGKGTDTNTKTRVWVLCYVLQHIGSELAWRQPISLSGITRLCSWLEVQIRETFTRNKSIKCWGLYDMSCFFVEWKRLKSVEITLFAICIQDINQ